MSGVAGVESVTQVWLSERLGMSAAVGAEWVSVLTRQGWLTRTSGQALPTAQPVALLTSLDRSRRHL